MDMTPICVKEYEAACNNVVEVFSEKYEVSVSRFDWVGGTIGGIISINDEFFLNMEDMVLMLRNDIPWSAFIEWWDYNTDAHYLGINSINLRSWVMGAPRLSKEQIEGLKEKKQELQDLVDKYNEKF